MSILFANAPAGAGKTRALIEMADRLAKRGRKVLFVQPSKRLIDSTIRDELMPLNPTYGVTCLHGDAVGGGVVSSLTRHFQNPKEGSEIVLTTHAALLLTDYLEKAQDWVLIMDEVLPVDAFASYDIPETHHLITDLIKLIPVGPTYGRLQVDEIKRGIRKIARNEKRDSVLDLFRDLAGKLTSDFWEVYTHQQGYAALLAGKRQGGRLLTYSILQPSFVTRFGSAILASACFENTMLYQLWAAMGTAMRPIELRSLRYTEHKNGHLLTIGYLSNKKWTSQWRKSNPGDNPEIQVFDRVVEIVSREMGDSPFAWMANAEVQHNPFEKLPEAVRIPNTPHGLNCFQHLNRIAVLSSLNPPPSHFAFLKTQGVDSEAVRTAYYHLTIYQALMRIAVRNPDNSEKVFCLVVDLEAAEALSALFPGSTIRHIEGLDEPSPQKLGRKPIHVTDQDRKRAHRASKIELVQRELKALNPHLFGDETTYIKAITSPNLDLPQAHVALPSAGSVFEHMYSTRAWADLGPGSADEFISFLRDLHASTPRKKEACGLLSPAHFHPDIPGVETKRGLANIAHLSGIWLDNDGGDLTLEEFADIFAYLRMAAWNTHSSTPDRPRWRVFIPTNIVMTPEVYRMIIGLIEERLAQAGYCRGSELGARAAKSSRTWLTHGFDTSKFAPNSVFYAPCQARHPRGSFFIDFIHGRTVLDVFDWAGEAIRMMPVAPEVKPAPPSNGSNDNGQCSDESVRRNRVEKAIMSWRSAAKGSGHAAYFRLGVSLYYAGIRDGELVSMLDAEALHARSPEERKRDARTIVKTLRKLARP